MAKIILVRHGQTDWNKSLHIQGGGSDTELNNIGKAQAERLGEYLKTEKIDVIYSSPLKRTIDTANCIARHHHLKIELEPELKEIDAAELEGAHVSEISAQLEQILIGQRDADELFEAYGGESLREVKQRAWSAIERIASKHPEETIVVVSHYFVILSIICAVLDIPLSRINRFRIGEGSINIIILDGKVPRLVLLNDISHLKSLRPQTGK